MSDTPFAYPQNGVVVDNVDPLGLYRVRVMVPGLIEPASAWAFPFGTSGGGSAKRGGWIVPAVGADVVVMFLGGDPERPIYSPAWWGKPDAGEEMSTGVADVPANERHEVQTLELGRLLVTVDERKDKRSIRFEDKETGDGIAWDLEEAKVMIAATSGLLFKCDGAIDIDGLQVTINGRLVATSGKAI